MSWAMVVRMLVFLSLLLVSLSAHAQSTNALLNGGYAFLVSGYGPQNAAVAMVGLINCDGNGNLSGFNRVDVAKVGAGPHPYFGVTGSCAVVSNYRAKLTLVLDANTTLTFVAALAGITGGAATQAGMVETDGLYFTSGTMEKRNNASSPDALTGTFAIGLHGKVLFPNGVERQVGLAGSFTVNSGTLTNTLVDVAASNTLTSSSPTGTLNVNAGVGPLSLSGSVTFNGVAYVIDANRWLVMGTGIGGALCTGTVERQTGGPFSLASAKGADVFSESRWTEDGVSAGGSAAIAGLMSFDGNGSATFSVDLNDTGTIKSFSGMPGGYAVTSATNGRFTFTGFGDPAVAYAVAPNTFFVLLGNTAAELASIEPQTGGPFSNASAKGTYSAITQPLGGPIAAGSGVSLDSAVYTLDGAGSVSGTEDWEEVGWQSDGTLGGSSHSGGYGTNGYTVAANGRFTTADGNSVGYIVSPAKAIAIDTKTSHANPTVTVLTTTGATAQVTPQSGWWWDPKLNGTGFFIEYGGVSAGGLFAGGFLYDASGNNTWLVSTGPLTGSAYTNTWLKATGGQTLLGSYQSPVLTTAGNIGLTFTDPSHAVMTRPDGTTVNLQRFSFTASSTPVPPEDGAPNIGWWWGGSALSGTGYGIEIQGSSVFIVAFVYDNSGNPVWYLATGALTDPQTYTGSWDVYQGGPQLTSPEGTYSAHLVPGASVPMSLKFTDDTDGTLTMGSVTIPIVRLQTF